MNALRDAVTAFFAALDAAPARDALVAELDIATAVPAVANAPDAKLALFTRGLVFKCMQGRDQLKAAGLDDLFQAMADAVPVRTRAPEATP